MHTCVLHMYVYLRIVYVCVCVFRSGAVWFVFVHGMCVVCNTPRPPPQPTPSTTTTQHVLEVLKKLCSDPKNTVFVISGRARTELAEWFDHVPNLGLAAEHGFFFRCAPSDAWSVKDASDTFTWKELVLPILQVCGGWGVMWEWVGMMWGWA